MKKVVTLSLTAALMLGMLTGCAPAVRQAPVETWAFTDSCGRTVDVPTEINEIVPSGSLAQMILYTVCPEKLQSLSTPLSRVQKQYIDEACWDLPVTGQFYGGGSVVNYEEIIEAAPDIIIDVGEKKTDISGDMDTLTSQTGIPVVFIEASLETMADAYETIGRLTGEPEQAALCADYIHETLSGAAAFSAQIPENERKRVLYAQGEYGTEVLGAGSVHAEVLEYACAVNAARLDSAVNSEGGNETSMEQIMLWDPEVVILSPDANYGEIFSDPLWANVAAVKNGEVYEAPEAPYNWMDRPPSVQRVLAIKWLGNLLYPDVFDYDMTAEAGEFYRLFWHYELTEAEARELMANSTYKTE